MTTLWLLLMLLYLQALPSLAEVMYKQFKQKKESLVSNKKEEVLAKYGNQGELAPPVEV
jgi:pre-mRNA-processing factor SLU7